MASSWINSVTLILRTLSQILAAGIAITAFSLWINALTYNLKDRVVRAFMVIMVCVVIVFTSDAIGSTATTNHEIENWLRFQWIGILYLPPAYFQFSDAILATTGKPSRGRRRWTVRITYIVSTFFLMLLPIGLLVGRLANTQGPAAYLMPTIFTELFTVYYAGTMVVSLYNFFRAYRRTLSTTTHRRMLYLLTGAAAPAIGSFPFLLYSSQIAASHNLAFWLAVCLMNIITGGLIVAMAYAVAFFGVSWPDRVIKTRMFRWIMRGPVTAAITLAFTTLIRRVAAAYGFDSSAIIPIVMVLTILMLEYFITLFAPIWERILFYGKDREAVDLLQSVSDRLVTRNDLSQYLEAILAAAVDRFRSDNAFIAEINQGVPEFIVTQGADEDLKELDLKGGLQAVSSAQSTGAEVYRWADYLLQPLHDPDQTEEVQAELLGIMGIHSPLGTVPEEEEEYPSLVMLGRRAAIGIKDNRLQEQIVKTLQVLNPQVDEFQRMQAAVRFASTDMFLSDEFSPQSEMSVWVRDALTHFWGGPKLTQNPLLQMKIVQDELNDHDQNQSNALRTVLRKAIDKTRPDGERRLTGEWILYNILELKFIEGRKVREVALRLSMSEADLYRKQRVAIETVAKALLEMEAQRGTSTSLASEEGGQPKVNHQKKD